MRMASAEARRVLVEMASQKFSVPADQLTVVDGVVQSEDRRRQEGDLRRTDWRALFQTSSWNGTSSTATPLRARQGTAQKPSEYKIIGKADQARGRGPEVFCQEDFVTDVKVPGMVHARIIRPPVAGSVPVKVDESSIAGIPGAKVVWKNAFLGVVGRQGMGCHQAMQKLKVEWSSAKPPFPAQASLYDHIRKSTVRKRQVDKENGKCRRRVQDRGAGDRGRVRVAVPVPCPHGAGLRAGRDQRTARHLLERHPKSHFVQSRRCAILDLPLERVRVIWQTGPGSYGRNDADDCAMDAAVLAKAVGKPVRLQGMRRAGHRLGPEGARLDPQGAHGVRRDGNITAYEFTSKGFSRGDVDTTAASRRTRWRGIPLAWS